MRNDDNRAVTIRQRLRPLRLAFLVRPDDKDALRRVFQINTAMWGGMFNPIIPFVRRARTPRWPAYDTARSIVQGYVDALEPDYVVVMSKDRPKHLRFPEERMLAEKEVLDPSRRPPMGYCAEAADLYSALHEKEFRFQRREPVDVIMPSVEKAPMALLTAACFGEFPPEKAMAYVAGAFARTFEPRSFDVGPSNLFGPLLGQPASPLSVGAFGLQVRRRAWTDRLVFFLMDGTSAFDALDFWNLRLIGWQALPVPRQWAGSLTNQCEEVIDRYRAAYPDEKKSMGGAVLLCSRTTPEDEAKRFSRSLPQSTAKSLVHQNWYPRIWDCFARRQKLVVRCDIVADERDTRIAASDSMLSFRDLKPWFANHVRHTLLPKWANDVELSDLSQPADSAGVIPPSLPNLHQVLGEFPFGRVWATRDGVVVSCQVPEAGRRWHLPSSLNVFQVWAEQHSSQIELSGTGRIAEQLVRAVGGVRGVDALAHEEIVTLLDQMACGTLETEVSGPQGAERATRVRGRIVSVGELTSRLQTIMAGDKRRAGKVLRFLVEHKALEVGLRLQCKVCGQHNWYRVEALGDQLTCERCLQEYDFPSAEPPPNAWFYRAIGPFSVEDYAQGAYCVALALRFLGSLTTAEYTWIPSFMLRKKARSDLEADFAMFRRDRASWHEEPVLVLGECKSYGRFLQKDVDRMRRLGDTFPGTTLVFCTFRRELDGSEKKRIAGLAKRGRESLAGERWLHPVLVLTGDELFSDISPPEWWRQADEGHRAYPGLSNHCNISQQLHLDMTSYSEWLDKKYGKQKSVQTRWTEVE